MPKSKKVKTAQAHTAKSPKGMGDYYGTGVRQKLGRVVDGMGMKQISPKKLKKPPKTLA
jgi:hypothetical protein